MKKIIILMSLLFSCSVAFGQIYKNFKTMHHVYEDWLNRQSCDTLYYAERVSPEVIDNTIKLISSNNTFPLYDLYIGKETKPLRLTAAEKSYIIGELQKLKTFSWPSSMFPSSKRIALSGMGSVFGTTNQFDDEKWKLCSLIYSFSKPIFFREGTICLYIDQEIYSGSNSRIFTQFFQQINGHWEEYADVLTQLGEEQDRSAGKIKRMDEQILGSQTSKKGQYGTSAYPETINDFGKRIFLIFQQNNRESFSTLYPTLTDRITLSKREGVEANIDTSNDNIKDLQVQLILRFDYDCLTIFDKAKTLNINWSKAMFTGAKKTVTALEAKYAQYGPKTITNLEVDFSTDGRKFKIVLGGVLFINNTWKILSVSGPIEIS